MSHTGKCANTESRKQDPWMCVCVYMQVYVHVWMYVYIIICKYVCTCVWVYVYLCICIWWTNNKQKINPPNWETTQSHICMLIYKHDGNIWPKRQLSCQLRCGPYFSSTSRFVFLLYHHQYFGQIMSRHLEITQGSFLPRTEIWNSSTKAVCVSRTIWCWAAKSGCISGTRRAPLLGSSVWHL